MSDKWLAKKNNSDYCYDCNDLILVSKRRKGLQNISNDDVTMPRLAIVQSGSYAQRKKKDEKYELMACRRGYDI